MNDEHDNPAEQEKLRAALHELRTSHRNLDREITALREIGTADMLKIGRMKKLKLKLKDQIRVIADKLTPDIIA